MSSLFFESPVLLGSIGLAVTLLALFAWTQVSDPVAQKISLRVGIATLLLSIAAVFISLQVKTETERITERMHAAASALESNNHSQILGFVHPNAPELKSRAQALLNRISFSDARVTRIKQIQVNNDSSPPTAIAEINVVVEAEDVARIPRFVKVYFMKQREEWYVRDYEDFNVAEGFKKTQL